MAAPRNPSPATITLYAETLLQNRQFDAAETQRKRLEQIDPENKDLVYLRTRVILGRAKPGGAAIALEDAYLADETRAAAEPRRSAARPSC